MSKQRTVVYEVVRNSYSHPTAEDVYLQAKQIMPSIVLATVYNNLNSLVEKNLVRRVKIHGQPDRFDGTLVSHEHAICDRCGTVADVALDDITDAIENKTGLHVTSYDLSIHHICESCKSRELRRRLD